MKPTRNGPCPICHGAGRLHVRRDPTARSHRWGVCVFEPRKRWTEVCPLCHSNKLAGRVVNSNMPLQRCFHMWNRRFCSDKTRRPYWTPIHQKFPTGSRKFSWHEERELWRRLFLGEPWVRLVEPGLKAAASTWNISDDDVPWRLPAPRVWNTRCLPWFREREIPTPDGPQPESGQLMFHDELPEDFADPYTREEILFLASGLPTVFSHPAAHFTRAVGGRYQFRLRNTSDEKIQPKVEH